MRRYFATNKELNMLLGEMTKARRICKCSHSILIPPEREYVECNYCHRLVFKNKKSEFDYRMKQNLIKEKRKLKMEGNK